MRHILLPLAASALCACGVARPGIAVDHHREQVKRAHGASEVSVLFIGNSYSFGVPEAFAKLTASHGRRVHVEQVTHGGWTLARHAADAETLRKIHERPWDVVVLQEQSQLPSYPLGRASRMIPAVKKLAAEIERQGGTAALYQTWGRRDRFMEMNRQLREGYRIASEEGGGLPVVPVGDAWEREVSAGRSGRLFQHDGSHPTAYGDLVSAKVFYQALMGRRDAVSPLRRGAGSASRRPAGL